MGCVGGGKGMACENGLDSRETRVGGEIKGRFSEMAAACSWKTLTRGEKGMEAWGGCLNRGPREGRGGPRACEIARPVSGLATLRS